MKLLKYILLFSMLSFTTAFSVEATSATGELEEIMDSNPEYVDKGQQLFKLKILKYCKNKDPELNGTKIAKSLSQEEWNDKYISGNFSNYMKTMCGIPDKAYNEKFNKFLIHFFWFNGQGSGNVPSCA